MILPFPPPQFLLTRASDRGTFPGRQPNTYSEPPCKRRPVLQDVVPCKGGQEGHDKCRFLSKHDRFCASNTRVKQLKIALVKVLTEIIFAPFQAYEKVNTGDAVLHVEFFNQRVPIRGVSGLQPVVEVYEFFTAWEKSGQPSTTVFSPEFRYDL